MFALIYGLAAKPRINSDDVQAILSTSQSFKKEKSFTGYLLYHDHEFIQLLEGKNVVGKDLYSKIVSDTRHHYV